MKYFINTKFIESKQNKTFLGIKYGEPKLTIDLISIGVVSEEVGYNASSTSDEERNRLIKEGKWKFKCNSREYYAISKDFNLKAAWNNEWVRENVLAPIYFELTAKRYNGYIPQDDLLDNPKEINPSELSYIKLKNLIQEFGKTNKQIAQEIIEFISRNIKVTYKEFKDNRPNEVIKCEEEQIEFYGYNCSYDWIVLNQLFEEVPKGFPNYYIDLKQELDRFCKQIYHTINEISFEQQLNKIKEFSGYPKQTNEHNALANAKWNYELYKFLNTL